MQNALDACLHSIGVVKDYGAELGMAITQLIAGFLYWPVYGRLKGRVKALLWVQDIRVLEMNEVPCTK